MSERNEGFAVPQEHSKGESEWGKVEVVNVSEVTLYGDAGGSRIVLGWETIHGESNMRSTTLRDMLSQVFELMGLPKEKAGDYIKEEEGDPDNSPFGVEKINISLSELCELTGRDQVDTRDAIRRVTDYFLKLSSEKESQ